MRIHMTYIHTHARDKKSNKLPIKIKIPSKIPYNQLSPPKTTKLP